MYKTGSDEYRAHRFEQDFLKQGGNGGAALFKTLSQETQDFLAEIVRFQSGEIPVIAFFENESTWLVATSRRVIWSRPGFTHQLKYAEIQSMGWSSGPEGAKTRERPDAIDSHILTQKGMELTKHASPWLFFFDTSGNRHEALLEPGVSVTAVWNPIMLMLRLEKIHPRTDDSASS